MLCEFDVVHLRPEAVEVQRELFRLGVDVVACMFVILARVLAEPTLLASFRFFDFFESIVMHLVRGGDGMHFEYK